MQASYCILIIAGRDMVKEEYDSHVASHNGLLELTCNANSVPPLGRRSCFRDTPFIGFDVTLHIGKYRFVKRVPPLGLMSWLVIVILKIGVIVVGVVLPFIVPITVALLVIIMVHHFSTILLVVILRD